MVVPTSAGNFRDTVYRFTQWFEKIGRLYSTSQNSPYFINHSQFHQPFPSLSHGFRQEVPRAQKLKPASTQRQVLSKGGLNCSVFKFFMLRLLRPGILPSSFDQFLFSLHPTQGTVPIAQIRPSWYSGR